MLYTVDPSRPASGQARIDAASGLGEQVVGGSFSPDVFLVDRSPLAITLRRIQPKGENPDSKEQAPAVSEQTILSLAEAGLKTENPFGSPQDIEWAEDEEGNLVFLQTRPLGVAADAGKHRAPEVSGLKLLFSAGQTASPGAVSGVAVHAKAGLKPEAVENAILVDKRLLRRNYVNYGL